MSEYWYCCQRCEEKIFKLDSFPTEGADLPAGLIDAINAHNRKNAGVCYPPRRHNPIRLEDIKELLGGDDG